MTAQQNAFLAMVVRPAQAAQKKWSVPASVTIAQAILESSGVNGWGKSSLALKANNYFGIKATHLDDPNSYIEVKTQEYVHGEQVSVQARFQKYDTLLDSFEAHARLLATAPRYKPAMAVCKDSLAFARELQYCGYSTSPVYGKTLDHLICEYDLTQYDVPPEDPAAAKAQAAA